MSMFWKLMIVVACAIVVIALLIVAVSFVSRSHGNSSHRSKGKKSPAAKKSAKEKRGERIVKKAIAEREKESGKLSEKDDSAEKRAEKRAEEREPQRADERVEERGEVAQTAAEDGVREEDAAEESEGDEKILVTADKRVILVAYNRSFTAKLIQGGETLQRRYGAVRNMLLGYGKVKSRVSWKCDTLRSGRTALAKIAVRGKTLSLYLALDPNDPVAVKYGAEDASEVRQFAAVPLRLKIKSERKLKYAAELIARLAEKFSLVQGDAHEETYFMPYESDEALIERGLIKVLADSSLKEGEVRKANIADLIRGSISVSEADGMITDTAAATLIEVKENGRGQSGGKKGVVNIDDLSKNYIAGEKVTLPTLKEKGLVAKNVGYVKVLARGTLDKPLIVEAQDFSLQAVKMIALTGGKAQLAR